ncbi:MAG: glycine cleavage system aminomethyltransferase GcvT [Chloroflexota bacterium]|nr:glycine cleavage system aminomethyltransferase GcvT [Chloroflexota bacterium]MDE3101908.1 glycine cleavage system aminomethyltransferase GcvT [Chloroflexota bacterium]
MSAVGTLRRTPLYEEHLALGAKMVPFAGWEMPIQYPTGIVAEHRAVRSAAGIFDLSHMGEAYLRGPKALAAVDELVSSDIAGLAVGQARYGLLCNERGTIVDDVIVYRVAPETVLICVNASNREKDVAHMRAHLPSDVAFEDASLATALIAVQGPRAAAILASVAAPSAGGSIASVAPFAVTGASVAGERAHVARTGYTGEDGFEIFVAWDRAAGPWSRLLDAGRGGLTPTGLGARDTLRLESRYSLYGNEIDETTDPIEAGLGWTCKLDKDFIGRDAIAAAKERGPSRRIVGLVVDGGVARHGFAVVKDGRDVGTVTSGTFGPTVGKNIALAYVPVALANVGTELAVRIRDREVPARVVKTPFYSRKEKVGAA